MRTIVLLGVGHTNAHIVRMWRMHRPPRTSLICVSDFPIASYSGMMPGVLAGLYPVERMEIDLVRLCASSGARLIVDQVRSLDLEEQRLEFSERPSLPFDALSVGVGSVPDRSDLSAKDRQKVLPLKPMQTFLARLHDVIDHKLESRGTKDPLRVVIAGGGAGGVEIAFCLPRRIARDWPDLPLELALVHSAEQLGAGSSPRTARNAERLLRNRNVDLRLGRRVASVAADHIMLDDNDTLAADVVVWATQATASPLLSQLGLPTDDRGFLLTRDTLQTTADAPVFAVGDCGTLQHQAIPKAGVYAVRQGPILWDNLRRMLDKKSLRSYQPQRGFLKLFNTGDGKALIEYKGFNVHRRWCWWLKDAIDQRFMDKYQSYEPMSTDSAMTDDAEEEDAATGSSNKSGRSDAMRCLGCGGKVGANVLSKVLARLSIPNNPRIVLGLDNPDDAAVILARDQVPLSLTVDFFAAPLDDPYVVGRIAALNALSDVAALGGEPLAALAIVTLPIAPPANQEQLLFELLSGSLQELRKTGAVLVGGHTIEGPRLAIGFTIVADQPDGLLAKSGLQPGQELVLTKPLGSGVLLAAQMQAACRAQWMAPLLETMLGDNFHAARLASENGVSAATDVTGFGLAGHLLEMLRASSVSATLNLNDIPLLPGAEQLVSEGIESSLAPSNQQVEVDIQVSEELRSCPAYRLLFDPQTSGGLLLAAPQGKGEQLVALLAAKTRAAVIGQIQAGPARIEIR